MDRHLVRVPLSKFGILLVRCVGIQYSLTSSALEYAGDFIVAEYVNNCEGFTAEELVPSELLLKRWEDKSNELLNLLFLGTLC